jgi:DNA modification methylase
MSAYFSVLDTRTSKWKSRKKWWIDMYGIQSEQGRDGTKSKSGFWENNNSVSVFDPVLCERMYTDFVPPSGAILDPFAGGSVRGIVATALGFGYTGIELSRNQVMANQLQSTEPNWIVGDSNDELLKIKEEFDFVFTCPPYHDLEVYSEDPRDISNMDYDEFLIKLTSILSQSAQKLKDNRFMGIVVSEIRDTGSTRNYKIGKYKNFVSDVIRICEDIGLHFYNDMILYNSQHQASRTSGVYFKRNRKVASVHQNVLIFVKGNPDLATEDIDWDDTYECTVNGTDYKSFRGAAISIDPIELVGSEVKRRCKSTKSKYKDWQLYGNTTQPIIKYVIGGVPFETPAQVVDVIGGGITETNVRTYISSTKRSFRHWKRISKTWDIGYNELEQLHNNTTITVELPTISCEGLSFYSQTEAGDHFGVTKERIRQKLKSSKHPDYIYL